MEVKNSDDVAEQVTTNKEQQKHYSRQKIGFLFQPATVGILKMKDL